MLVFDLETDGFLTQATTIHCISIYDTETEKTVTYNDKGTQEPVVRDSFFSLCIINRYAVDGSSLS